MIFVRAQVHKLVHHALVELYRRQVQGNVRVVRTEHEMELDNENMVVIFIKQGKGTRYQG